jgi:hypothetical protein
MAKHRLVRARQGVKTRLILLGTGGGPRPRKGNSAPAQVIVANDTAYVIDCGNGVARQLAAGVPLSTVRHTVTHHHSTTTPTTGISFGLRGAPGCVHELMGGAAASKDDRCS